MKVLAAIEVEVDFFYQPKEAPDHGPEARYPGCAESLDIVSVRVGEVDITRRLTDEDMASIHEAIWEAIE
jgi:hypothetical protein